MLHLHLVSASGVFPWKTELPYTIAKGAKNLNNEMVVKALLTHVRAHANEIGWTELRTTTRLAASQHRASIPRTDVIFLEEVDKAVDVTRSLSEYSKMH
jgi:hypothetical protein